MCSFPFILPLGQFFSVWLLLILNSRWVELQCSQPVPEITILRIFSLWHHTKWQKSKLERSEQSVSWAFEGFMTIGRWLKPLDEWRKCRHKKWQTYAPYFLKISLWNFNLSVLHVGHNTYQVFLQSPVNILIYFLYKAKCLCVNFCWFLAKTTKQKNVHVCMFVLR